MTPRPWVRSPHGACFVILSGFSFTIAHTRGSSIGRASDCSWLYCNDSSNQRVAGSIPARENLCLYSTVVVRLTCNEKVGGSIPPGGKIFVYVSFA